ncbi:hypothetical protein NL418_014825 [Escherichia coli]|nr:hypothetical protein [Escherichia coli]WCQ51724.1 hypothetical protein NL418_014825 [Escherichia coli]
MISISLWHVTLEKYGGQVNDRVDGELLRIIRVHGDWTDCAGIAGSRAGCCMVEISKPPINCTEYRPVEYLWLVVYSSCSYSSLHIRQI